MILASCNKVAGQPPMFSINLIQLTMNKISILLIILLVSFISSCNNTTDDVRKTESIKIDIEGADILISFIDFNVTKFQKNISLSRSNNNQPDLKFLLRNIREYERLKGLNFHYSTTEKPEPEKLSESLIRARQTFQDKLSFCISTSSSEDEFLLKLSNLKIEVLNDQTDNIIKSELLSQIVLFEKFIGYIQTKITLNTSITTSNEDDGKCKGWWSCWGKCIAGTLGGAGTGALTFGLAGAAVGTVTLPVVGTVSAGTVGAIGGAIAGGLTGAASSCD